MDDTPTSRLAPVVALLLAVLIGFWHGASARPGHPWSGLDDFTAYLAHGRNLIEGREYAAIDTVVDTQLPPANLRKAFPPAFPLLLAVTEQIGSPDAQNSPLGFDALLFKRVNAGLFALSLFLVFVLFRRELGDGFALLALLLVGTLPFLFHFREFVRSEWLFLALVLATLVVMGRFDRCSERGSGRWALALLAGVLGGLAYAARTAGMVLPLALLVYELWTQRRVRAPVVLVVGVILAVMVGMSVFFPDVTAGYASHAGERFGLATVFENLKQYAWDMQRLLCRSWSDGVALLSLGALVLLSLVGQLTRLAAPSRAEVFAAGTLAMQVLLPTDSAWLRYLVPLLPFGVFLVLVGARWIGRRRPSLAALPGIVGVLVLGLGLPGLVDQPGGLTGATALDDGPTTAPATEAFDWIRERTEADDVVVFRKPWTLTLATGRPAHVYPQAHLYPAFPLAEHWAHLERTGARWLLLRHRPRAEVGPYRTLDYDDRWYLDTVVAAEPGLFAERARNDEFVLFERAAVVD